MQLQNCSIATLMDGHPYTSDVLTWHGIEPHDIDQRMSLGTVAWLHSADVDQLCKDLVQTAPDIDAVTELVDVDEEDDEWIDDRWDEEVVDEDDAEHGPDAWWNEYVDYDVERGW